jgi:hypothetical protein
LVTDMGLSIVLQCVAFYGPHILRSSPVVRGSWYVARDTRVAEGGAIPAGIHRNPNLDAGSSPA